MSGRETSVVRIRRKGGAVVQDCDVYIGRKQSMGGWNLPQSDWANPFSVKECGSNEEACRRYEEYVRGRPELMARLWELRGKTLGCWCKPAACHGDVLVRLVAETAPPVAADAPSADIPEEDLLCDEDVDALLGV